MKESFDKTKFNTIFLSEINQVRIDDITTISLCSYKLHKVDWKLIKAYINCLFKEGEKCGILRLKNSQQV